MTKEDAARVLKYLIDCYPGKGIAAGTVETYGEALMHLPPNVAMGAARHHVATNNWWPSIAELLKFAAELAVAAPSVEDAWTEVLSKIHSVGRYRVPRWSHPLIASAVGAMGWDTLCNSENISIECGQFARIYGSYRTHETERAQAAPLTGQAYVPRLQGATTAGEAVRALLSAPSGAAALNPREKP